MAGGDGGSVSLTEYSVCWLLLLHRGRQLRGAMIVMGANSATCFRATMEE